MIKVIYQIKSDLKNKVREEWPDMLPALPRAGDLIQSRIVHPNGFSVVLEVNRVSFVPLVPLAETYINKIELGPPFGFNTDDFLKWYNKQLNKPEWTDAS